MDWDLFWDGSVFQCHMFFLKRNNQRGSLVLVYLLQVQCQIWNSTRESYCAGTTPRSASLSPTQIVGSHRSKPRIREALNCVLWPPCCSHRDCHTCHILFHPRPSHMSFPPLMILSSFWPINSYLAFSSQFMEDPAFGPQHLGIVPMSPLYPGILLQRPGHTPLLLAAPLLLYALVYKLSWGQYCPCLLHCCILCCIWDCT